jgi:hypothetical protein
MVSVEVTPLVPLGVTEIGLKLHEVFAGSPEHAKLTD